MTTGTIAVITNSHGLVVAIGHDTNQTKRGGMLADAQRDRARDAAMDRYIMEACPREMARAILRALNSYTRSCLLEDLESQGFKVTCQQIEIE